MKTPPEVLEELERLHKAATQPPWTVQDGYDGSGPWDRRTVEGNGVVACTINRMIDAGKANGELIPAARNALPSLIADSRALSSLLADLEAKRAEFGRRAKHERAHGETAAASICLLHADALRTLMEKYR